MLGGSSSGKSSDSTSKQIAALKHRLEESWGSHDRIREELTKQASDDNYDEDEFEKHEDIDYEAYKKDAGFEDEEEKLVDEEINLTSSGGSSTGSAGGSRKDSDFLKELMKPPLRTKFSS